MNEHDANTLSSTNEDFSLFALFESTLHDDKPENIVEEEDDNISQHTCIFNVTVNDSSSGCGGDDDDAMVKTGEDFVEIIYHLACLAPGHGDTLWNSSMCIAEHILSPTLRQKLFGDEVCHNQWPPSRALEFGAGAALPSLALIKEGSRRTVLTDRKINDMTFEALEKSIAVNCEKWDIPKEEWRQRAVVMPHTWGDEKSLKELLFLDNDNVGDDDAIVDDDDVDSSSRIEKNDLLIASDCIYNPMYHDTLLQSCDFLLSKDRGLLVVGYSYHGNVCKKEVEEFFTKAEENDGLKVITNIFKAYSEQRGTSCNEKNRGHVYLKVLANVNSQFC